MNKQYIYTERTMPATPRNKRLTDAIRAAATTGGGGGYIGGVSLWELVTEDEAGNALAEGAWYVRPATGAVSVVSERDVVAYAKTSPVATTPVASTSTFGLVKVGSGVSVSGGVISVSGTGGLDEAHLKAYLTANEYATQAWVTNRGYLTSSSLYGYATTSYVNDKLSGYVTTGTLSDTLSGYVTTGTFTTALNNYVTIGTAQTIKGQRHSRKPLSENPMSLRMRRQAPWPPLP